VRICERCGDKRETTEKVIFSHRINYNIIRNLIRLVAPQFFAHYKTKKGYKRSAASSLLEESHFRPFAVAIVRLDETKLDRRSQVELFYFANSFFARLLQLINRS